MPWNLRMWSSDLDFMRTGGGDLHVTLCHYHLLDNYGFYLSYLVLLLIFLCDHFEYATSLETFCAEDRDGPLLLGSPITLYIIHTFLSIMNPLFIPPTDSFRWWPECYLYLEIIISLIFIGFLFSVEGITGWMNRNMVAMWSVAPKYYLETSLAWKWPDVWSWATGEWNK